MSLVPSNVLLVGLSKEKVMLTVPDIAGYVEHAIPPDIYQIPVTMFDIHNPTAKISFYALFMVPNAITKDVVISSTLSLGSLISQMWREKQTDANFPLRVEKAFQLPAIELDTTAIESPYGKLRAENTSGNRLPH
jgi:hypothetical protein